MIRVNISHVSTFWDPNIQTPSTSVFGTVVFVEDKLPIAQASFIFVFGTADYLHFANGENWGIVSPEQLKIVTKEMTEFIMKTLQTDYISQLAKEIKKVKVPA